MAKANSGEIARRYARALFELVVERGLAVEVLHQLGNFLKVMDKDVFEALCGPLYEESEKERVLETAVESLGMNALLANTLRVMLRNRRFELVHEMYQAFRERVDQHMGVLRATLVSARPVDVQTVEQFEEALSQGLGKKVFLVPAVEESLVAGYMIRVGNTVVDATLGTRLRRLRDSVGQGV